jgi:hypothetical protein
VIRAWLTSVKEKPVFVSDIMENGFPEKEFRGFDTAADFDKWRKEMIERAK